MFPEINFTPPKKTRSLSLSFSKLDRKEIIKTPKYGFKGRKRGKKIRLSLSLQSLDRRKKLSIVE